MKRGRHQPGGVWRKIFQSCEEGCTQSGEIMLDACCVLVSLFPSPTLRLTSLSLSFSHPTYLYLPLSFSPPFTVSLSLSYCFSPPSLFSLSLKYFLSLYYFSECIWSLFSLFRSFCVLHSLSLSQFHYFFLSLSAFGLLMRSIRQ